MATVFRSVRFFLPVSTLAESVMRKLNKKTGIHRNLVAEKKNREAAESRRAHWSVRRERERKDEDPP